MKKEKWENSVPETIEELKEWYADKRLPKESKTRFYIGRNYKYPKAFGIYKDSETGRFIVYKNKRNGARVIRYEGLDEGVAVRELHLRLVKEIENQKNPKKKMTAFEEIKEAFFNYGIQLKEEWYRSKKDFLAEFFMAFILLMGLIIGLCACICAVIDSVVYGLVGHINGYYDINNDHYYYQYGSWYLFEDSEGWIKQKRKAVPNELFWNKAEYKTEYKTEEPYTSFKSSGYYSKHIFGILDDKPSDNNDYNSRKNYYNYDYDSSWNSNYTDWDSDW